MSKNLVDVSTYDAAITVPADADARNAASVETAFQSLANRSLNLADRCGGAGAGASEWLYEDGPRVRTEQYPAAIMTPQQSVGTGVVDSGWNFATAGAAPPAQGREYLSKNIGQILSFEIGARVQAHGCTLTRVRAVVRPGAVRATLSDRMRLHLVSSTSLFGTPVYAGPLDEDEDDGTAASQILDTGVISRALFTNVGMTVIIKSGLTAGVDAVTALELTWSEPGPS